MMLAQSCDFSHTALNSLVKMQLFSVPKHKHGPIQHAENQAKYLTFSG